VVQEIGSDIDDRGDFDEVYDKIEDEGEAVVERGRRRRRRGKRRAFPHFYIQQDLVEFAGHERGEQVLWILHDRAGNFKVSM